MATKFVRSNSLKAVKADNQSAAKIVKVDGGYMVFETLADYKTWKNQK